MKKNSKYVVIERFKCRNLNDYYSLTDEVSMAFSISLSCYGANSIKNLHSAKEVVPKPNQDEMYDIIKKSLGYSLNENNQEIFDKIQSESLE